MRSKKALVNIITSLILQITAIVCGLIVPRLIISTYGSGVNGLVASISQFLTYIVLLEAGVGGVVRAALYKFLARNDILSISRVVKATEIFFKKIAFTFIIYLLGVAILLPFLVSSDFESFYTMTLVLIIGASIFFQYYFGISYQILLQADQKRYITTVLQLVTLIINTFLVVVLIKIGASIHFVKLGSSIIFVARPILLNIYVKKKYGFIKNCKPDNDAISQRWDGLGHHIAFFVTNSTDIVVLTILASVKDVSVYSVYAMIIDSIKSLTVTFSSGIEAAFGNMIANNEKELLYKNFKIFEFSSFSITTILFTSTSLLITPFISLYTEGVTDANYYRPVFSVIIVLASAIYCIRLPYNAVVLAAGHYRQTRNGALAEAIINIVISVILVNYYGIIGVAAGTLCAMLFRTFQYANYLSKNIIKRSLWEFIKNFAVYITDAILIIVVVNFIPYVEMSSYTQWLIYAIKVTSIASVITILIGLLVYFNEFKSIILIGSRILKNRK